MFQKKESYRLIGFMSGSSLDGMDIACCDYILENQQIRLQSCLAECISYPIGFTERLRFAHLLSGRNLKLLDVEYGHLIGKSISQFVQKHQLKEIDAICSHGHTIFHEPENKMSCQIGDGAAIAAQSHLVVINDLRAMDVALGGQGAPIVPIADRLLYTEMDVCLNLGGIANMTIHKDGKTKAFDISACNQVLNQLAKRLNREYDEDGKLAAAGRCQSKLLDQLNAIPFLHQTKARSLDNAFSRTIMDILESSGFGVEDLLCTYCHHLAIQISIQLKSAGMNMAHKMLVSGGGCLNHFLLERIREKCEIEVIKPDLQVILYKEAIAMALIGMLRLRGEENVICRISGAEFDSCGGALHLPIRPSQYEN